MKNDKKFTLKVSRREVQWLHDKLEMGLKKAEEAFKLLGDDVLAVAALTPLQKAERAEARTYIDALDPLVRLMKDGLVHGDKNRLKIARMTDLLEESRELVDEAAKEIIDARLKDLSKQEEYSIEFDKVTARFTIKLLELDIQHFLGHIIPAYEKAKESDFTDEVQNRTYYINAARRNLHMLEKLKTKLERSL